MLDRIDRLAFYFAVECANCRDIMKVSHETIMMKSGELFCSLCGKDVKVPDYEKLARAASSLNDYVSDSFNAKYIKLVLNEKYVPPDDMPAAGH
ncbi:MAG: hypothetical protein CVV42_15025 [Candidatus Riflebacteria bacterium HGW-Riflebacteria-2]|jgi:hypothetical protein|nr:MAG: hypothetical protein CVV42_15025 [Candidatus Riflebacteria bacterium HGW-Riflebacteria-2]